MALPKEREGRMTKDEALDLALEVLEWEEAQTAYPSRMMTKAIAAIKQARALDKMAENARELGLDYGTVQEPSCKDCRIDKPCSAKGKDLDVCSFYVPPLAEQRQWVEVEQIKWEFNKLIAKLKEMGL